MSYASEVLADAPGGYWQCQEASGAIQDSANSNDSTATTGTPIYQTSGPVVDSPFAIDFDADPTYFSIPDHTTLDLGNVFTLEAWVKRNATLEGIEAILSKASNAYSCGFFFNAFFYGKAEVAVIVSSTITITDTDVWHHCVATKNGATSKLYIDTADVTGTVTDLTCTDNASALQIGAEAGTVPINANMAHIAVYPTALSQARVQAHYDAATAAGATLAWLRA